MQREVEDISCHKLIRFDFLMNQFTVDCDAIGVWEIVTRRCV